MFYGTYYPMLASPMLLCLCKYQVPIAFVFNIVSFILWLRQMDIKRAFNKSHSGINSFLSLLFFWKSLQKNCKWSRRGWGATYHSFYVLSQHAKGIWIFFPYGQGGTKDVSQHHAWTITVPASYRCVNWWLITNGNISPHTYIIDS